MTANNSNMLNVYVNPNRPMTLADAEKIPLSLPSLMGWKDRESRYLGITDHLIHYAGLDTLNKLVGKSDYQINRFADFAKHYTISDQFAMNIKPLSIIENIRNSNHELVPIKTMKYPLYNAAFTKVIGVLYFCNLMENMGTKPGSSLLSQSASPIILSGSNYTFTLSTYTVALTNKESQVLYYYLRGRTAAQIATILMRSSRTIESYLVSIKYKLNCNSRADIVDFVITSGLFDFIPHAIIEAQKFCE